MPFLSVGLNTQQFPLNSLLVPQKFVWKICAAMSKVHIGAEKMLYLLCMARKQPFLDMRVHLQKEV